MANDIKLEVYTFSVRKLNSSLQNPEYFKLSDINGKDLLNLFKEYFTYLEGGLEKNDSQMKAIRLKEKSLRIKSGERSYSGIFESGSYGYQSDIVNVNTNKKKSTKTTEDAEILPFYFLLHIPQKMDVGVIMLQRFGQYGINTVFRESLRIFLSEKHQISIDINEYVSKELAEEFLKEDSIKEIILTKNNLPSDVANQLNLSSYDTKSLCLEIRVKAGNGKSFLGLSAAITNHIGDPNTKFFSPSPLKKLGIDGTHKVSVVSRTKGGGTRTIDLSDTMKIRPYYDINDQIETILGHPVFDSIDKEAKKLLDEINISNS